MLTPGEIASRRFTVALRGFERDEVETFLRAVADDVEALRSRVRELEAELEDRPVTVAPAPSDGSGPSPEASSAAEPGGRPRDRSALLRSLGDEAARLLVTAEESAEEIRRRAEADAERSRRAAEQEADTMLAAARAEREQTLEAARDEAARLRAEAASTVADAEGERARILEARDRLAERLRDAVTQVAEVAGRLEDGPPVDPVTTGAPTAASPPADPDRADADRAAPPATDRRGQHAEDPDVAGPRDGPADAPDEPEPLRLRRRTLGSVRPAMLRHARRALQDGQNAVLSRLAPRDVVDDDPPPPQAPVLEDGDFRSLDSAVATYLVGAMRGGGGDAAFLLRAPAPDEVVDPGTVAHLRALLRDVLRTQLQDRLDAAADRAPDERPALVDAAFEDARSAVPPLVDDALAAAYAAGQVAAATQLDAPGVRWVAVPEASCPDQVCAAAAAAGTVPPGASFPHGGAAPPAHPGCACGLAPVPDDPDAHAP